MIESTENENKAENVVNNEVNKNESKVEQLNLPEFIIVSSEDGKEFKISGKAASMSKLLLGAMQDFSGDINMPLQEVTAPIAEKVVDYLEHWKAEEPGVIEKPLKSGRMAENCDSWSANFIDSLTLEDVGEIAVAANFMEIQPLVDLACAKIASVCYGKSDEELLREHGIDPATFTEEEKQKIREENADWLEDDPEKLFNFDENEEEEIEK